MSPVQKLRWFVIQRLNAAVEEIMGVFEKTIEKYEEEAALSREVISRQHALLCALNKPIMELPPAEALTQQLSAGKCEVPPKLLDQHQEDPLHVEEEEVVGVLDEADIIKFTYSSRKYSDGMSLQPKTSAAAGTEPRVEDVQVLLSSSSSEDETEDSEDYNLDSGTTRSKSASNQPRPGPFICRVCSRTFRVRRVLFRHVRAHLQEKNLICGVCGERLETADSLKLHLETHMSSKKKKKKRLEPESPSRERPPHRRSRRKKNTTGHTDEKANTCSNCGKTFAQEWRKKKHDCQRSYQGQQKKKKKNKTS